MSAPKDDAVKRALDEDHAMQLKQEFAEILEEVGFKEPWASSIATSIVERWREKRGGQKVYVPACPLAERDAVVRRFFNGRNIDETCKQFDISRQTLYRIVSRI